MSKQDDDSRPLKPDHERFIREYLTNGNNATAAMVVAKPHLTRKSAGVTASELLKTGRIRTAIQQTAKALGLTDQFLLGHLKMTLLETIETSQERYDAEGNKLERVVWRRKPTPSEAAKVVDVINKSTGLYELNRAAGQALTSQFKELARKYRPKLSKRSDGKALSAQPVDAETSLEDVYQIIHWFSPCGIPAIEPEQPDATPSALATDA